MRSGYLPIPLPPFHRKGESIIWKKGVPSAPLLPDANIPTDSRVYEKRVERYSISSGLIFEKQVDRRKRQRLFLLSDLPAKAGDHGEGCVLTVRAWLSSPSPLPPSAGRGYHFLEEGSTFGAPSSRCQHPHAWFGVIR